MIAPWPMWAFSSSTTVTPGNMCMVQFSCTLQPSLIIISPQSPRMAAPGATYTFLPIITLPVTHACGCTKLDLCTTGRYPLNSYIIFCVYFLIPAFLSSSCSRQSSQLPFLPCVPWYRCLLHHQHNSHIR